MKNIPDYLYATSYFQPFSIVFKFDKHTLTVENFPHKYKKGEILLEIVDIESNCIFKEEVSYTKLNQGVLLNLLTNNIYFIRIYTPSEHTLEYKSLLFRSDVPFFYNSEKCRFLKTIVFKANVEFYNKLPNPTSLIPKEQRIRIRKFSENLTHDCKSEYDKILTIHDWITDNIYYDYDALKNQENRKKCSVKPMDVFDTKRSICQGITNLSIEMLKSVGVHCLGVVCFALGIDTQGGWENPSNIKAESNHIFTAALCNNRWILLDVTWDCENEYRNGKFIKSKGPTSHKYFDMTLEFLSNTHRLDVVDN